MKVPFLDLPAHHRSLRQELDGALARIVDEAAFILGPAVAEFERRFAAYLDLPYCVAVNSGTSALHLALLACDVGPGDEVVTTPLTWVSTAWAIRYVGARPVFADVDPVTYNLTPEAVEQAIGPRTRAILAVHLYGQTCDLAALSVLAESHGLPLIEDAAQAHGARFNGAKAGSVGRMGCFSFYPGKNLGAFGEGGAVVTRHPDLAERIRRLRDHAQERRHHHVEVGYNYRMEGLQGAVLATKLPHLDAWNAARSRHAARYRDNLAGLSGVVLPEATVPERHVWHLFVVQVLEGRREEIRRRLATVGIGVAVHYPTLVPLQPAFTDLGHGPGDFPVAEAVAEQCLSLPMYPELTDEQIDHVSAALRRFLDSAT